MGEQWQVRVLCCCHYSEAIAMIRHCCPMLSLEFWLSLHKGGLVWLCLRVVTVSLINGWYSSSLLLILLQKHTLSMISYSVDWTKRERLEEEGGGGGKEGRAEEGTLFGWCCCCCCCDWRFFRSPVVWFTRTWDPLTTNPLVASASSWACFVANEMNPNGFISYVLQKILFSFLFFVCSNSVYRTNVTSPKREKTLRRSLSVILHTK